MLAELVARGIPVHATARSPGSAQPGVIWHTADLREGAERARLLAGSPAKQLLHCAWEIEHGAFWTAPANDLWRRVSCDLAREFLAAGGERVLALGTCAEYDPLAPSALAAVRLVAPITPYGQAKASLHEELGRICGPRLIWARLFHLYGPGEDRRRLVPSLIDAAREGRPAEVRAAGLIRDFASSAHVARALVGLMDSGATGAFDIGSGQSRSLGALARIIAEAAGRPDLLRLSHTPGPQDPAELTPHFAALAAVSGLKPEHPLQALTEHVRREIGAA
ncbi:NAD-dependent epimerase/dehydratase family protein [Rhodobacter capsulatus]|uniref:NAD-dependent epimerase/dehydratase family protein n=1 Tax=Rhodobacter capsulatus (strain ATCC BAA-309 / NBRC 16581 / SB1003) TaxID=272942 RepID=D5AVE6_RHOCB|nr:NAD-dependent epimerase/dehydratase family protein [Rhodobacter capsulatus]ADE87281.1 NAD-dependent epimerase/dehydratase family protein [Rhodobacter capsulatus SB 1003]MDS0927643.1 NAD-dependent epimerase/dehydratase family protein [Rhodobacter capsulatus]